jgi:hypothetical protein
MPTWQCTHARLTTLGQDAKEELIARESAHSPEQANGGKDARGRLEPPKAEAREPAAHVRGPGPAARFLLPWLLRTRANNITCGMSVESE